MKKIFLSFILVLVLLVTNIFSYVPAFAADTGRYKTVDDVTTYGVVKGFAIRVNKYDATYLQVRFALKTSALRNIKLDYPNAEISMGVVFGSEAALKEYGLTAEASSFINEPHAYQMVYEKPIDEVENETGSHYVLYAKSQYLTSEHLYDEFLALGYIRCDLEDGTTIILNAAYDEDYNKRSVFDVATKILNDPNVSYSQNFLNNIKSYLERVIVLQTDGTGVKSLNPNVTLNSGAKSSSFEATASTYTKSSDVTVILDGVTYSQDQVPYITLTKSDGTIKGAIKSEWKPTDGKKTTVKVEPATVITWENFNLDLTLRTTVTGSTYTAKELRYTSSNPACVTVNQNGTLKLVEEGSSTITAMAPDGSIGTVEVRLTEALYRADNQLLGLNSIKATRYTTPKSLDWPTGDYGSTVLAYWKDDCTAACSFTVDDSLTQDFDAWIAATEATGIPVTFIAPGSFYTNKTHISGWQKLVAAGEDVQSHSYSGDSSTNYETYSTAMVWMDYYNGIWSVESVTGKPVRVIGFSYGWGKTEYSNQLFIAGRNGSQEEINNILNTNYDKINTHSCNWDNMFAHDGSLYGYQHDFILTSIDKNFKKYGHNNYGGWTNYHWHQISGASFTVNGTKITTAKDYIVYYFTNYLLPLKESGEVWFDTIMNIAMYGMERDSCTFTQTECTQDRICYEMTDLMDDTIYQTPITMKVLVDSTWTSVHAEQNGIERTASIVEDGGNTYILFEMVPDMGTLTLTH